MSKHKEEVARLNSELLNTKQELLKKNQELVVFAKRIEELTIVDPITGLYNLNFFNLQSPQIIARAKRNKTNICVALCTINPSDTQQLQALAHCLQTETREGQDSVYRLNEDEFLVVMEQSDEKSGLTVLGRVRLRFTQNSPDTTLSIGIASVSWKDLTSTLDDLIKTAAVNESVI